MKKIALFLLVVFFAVIGFAKTNLEVLWMGWPTDKVMTLVNEFQAANPDISVDVQLVPYGQLFQTIEVRLSGNSSTPDIFIVDGPLNPSYAIRGNLLALDEYFSEEELAPFFDASIETATFDGKLYSIPYTTSSAGLYFNKEIFDEYGIPYPPETPGERLTWEEVAEIAKKLTIDEDGDGTPEIWGLIIEQVDRPYQLFPLVQSLGGELISPDGLSTAGYLTSEEFLEAADFYWNLFNGLKVSPQGLNDSSISREYFGNGKAAMMLGADWNINRLGQFEELEFGLSPHPYFEGGEAVTPTGSWHVGINANTKNVDASVKFVKFLTSKEALAEWNQLFGHLPARMDSYDLLEKEFSKPEWQILFYEMDNTATARPITPGYLQYELILRETFNSIHYGSDPEQALKDAETRIDRELRKFK